jgi:ATP-dependent RNA helicase RhlB
MLIFANTKSGVEWLSRKLRGNGFPAEGITGDLPQRKRFQLMEKFKNNQVKILVATDVASRGIHIEDISHVVNYDLPQDAENYVHRIGRTARAGKAGISIALACEDYVLHLEPLEQMLGYKIPVVWPEDDWYEEDKAGPVRMPGRPHGKRPTSRKGPSPDRGRDKAKPRKEGPPPILMPNGKPRPAGYFPGTFFGFGPPGESAAASIEPPSASLDLEAVDESDVTETTDTQTEASVKKRRRRRRKKKSPAASAVEAQGSSPEPTVEEDESKPVPRRKSGSKPRSRSRGRTSAAKTRAGEAGDGGTTADVPSASGGPEADT